MYRGGGLLARKLGRFLTEAEARAAASAAVRDGYTTHAYVIRSYRRAETLQPNQPIAFYGNPDGEDETVRYHRLQAEPFTLPPPSPLDDLGEEE